MTTIDQAIAALDRHGIPDILAHLWSIEGAEGCDTANMLATLCETTESLEIAVGLLSYGAAPSEATPYPACAEWLLARRRKTSPQDFSDPT